MVTSALASVGVEAVVEGLSEFGKAFGSMNDWMDKFSAKGNLITRVFKPVNTVLSAFWESLRRISEFVVAGLILRGIEKITKGIRDMAAAIYDAAVSFQGLLIRLENFIAADLLAAGEVDSMAEALTMAKGPAEELFKWVQKIAIVTPFETKDIADAFTMAKAWGFNTEEAKNLTQQVIDFTAGMGLGGDAMDRVIKALGQMKSLGRVAGQELLQLANAGVPVADIMDSIRQELGLTTDEFEKLRMKGGVSAEMFFAKWEELVNTRFLGSSERMSRTISGVISNVKDLITGVLGFNVLKPVLDTISGKFADLLNSLTQGERFNVMLTFFDRIGDSLAGLGEVILGAIFPGDVDEMSIGILDFLNGLTQTISDTIDNISSVVSGDMSLVSFFDELFLAMSGGDESGKIFSFWENVKEVFSIIQDIAAGKSTGIREMFTFLDDIGVPEGILDFMRNLFRTFLNIQTFFEENGESLRESLDKVINKLLEAVGVAPSEDESLIQKVGDLIENLSLKLIENGPNITETVGKIAEAIAGDEGIVAKFGQFVDWIDEHEEEVLAFMENVGLGMLAFYTGAKILSIASFLIVTSLVAATGAVLKFVADFKKSFDDKPFWTTLASIPVVAMTIGLVNGIIAMIRKVKEILKIKSPSGVFMEIGGDIMEGMKQGILTKVGTLIRVVVGAVQRIIAAAKNALNMQSPSKVFMDIGENVMKGFAIGIDNLSDMPAVELKASITKMIQPLSSPLQGVTNNSQTVNNNFNMNINTQASAEPIASNFQMMKSLAGGG